MGFSLAPDRSDRRSHIALRAPAASTYEKKMLVHVFVRPCLYVDSTRPLVLVKHSVCFHYDSYALLYLGHYIIRAIGLGPDQMMMVVVMYTTHALLFIQARGIPYRSQPAVLLEPAVY